MPYHQPDQEVITALKTWFSHDKQNASINKDKKLLVATPTEVNTYNCVSVGTNKRIFSFLDKFDTKGYFFVLGIALNGKQARCRHFYKSASEGFWRVGTGFRLKSLDKDKNAECEWVKGAEYCTDTTKEMDGGYIFEGMVHPDLNKALEDMSVTKNCPLQHIYNACVHEVPPLKKYMNNVYRYSGGKVSAVTPSTIVDEYAQERQLVTVTGMMQWDDPQKTLDVTTKGQTKNLAQMIQSGNISQAQIQQHAFAKIDRKDTLSGANLEWANSLKELPELWKYINKCLKNPTGHGNYIIHHDLLGEKINVETYKLDNAFIEIAYSEPKERYFKDKTNNEYHVKSPVCWVKNVYYGNEVSSFGNFVTYPRDLCFLPQKPMDYDKQISAETLVRVGIQETFEAREKRLGSRQQAKTEVQEDMKNLPGNYILKGGMPTYALLALFNEKYCPLIREYKKMKHFDYFRLSKKQTTNANKGMIDAINAAVNKDVEILKDAIKRSCGLYLNYSHSSTSLSGGATGLKRVKAFREAIEKCQSLQDVHRSIDLLFMENKVGGECYDEGHWYTLGIKAGGKISNREQSYFSFFCKETLAILLPEYEAFCEHLSFYKERLSRQPELIQEFKKIKPADGWGRFVKIAFSHELIKGTEILKESDRTLLFKAIKNEIS